MGRAKALTETACKGGHAEACKGAAELRVDAIRAETGEKLDDAYRYARACDAGGMTACVTLGDGFDRGKLSLPEDVGFATSLYLKACESSGKLPICRKLTRTLRRSDDIEVRVQLGIVAWARGRCNGGDEDACDSLRRAVDDRGVGAEALAAMITFGQERCTAGHDACVVSWSG